MNENNFKNLIEIPKALDDVIAQGILKGQKHKKELRRKKAIKKGVLAASLTLITASLINPDLVSAIPLVNETFKSFNNAIFGEPLDKFEKSATIIGKTITNNGLSLTLNEAILDDNILMLGLSIEGNDLKNFKSKNEEDFFTPTFELLVDGKTPSSFDRTKITKLSETKASAIIYCNIANLNIGDSSKISFKVSSIENDLKVKNGNWNFNMELNKNPNGKRIPIDHELKFPKGNLKVKELITSDLTNTLILEGILNEKNSSFDEIFIKDNSNNYLRSKIISNKTNIQTGAFDTIIEIPNDLSKVNSLTITPKEFDSYKSKVVNNTKHILFASNTSLEPNFEEKLISRKPTKEEIASGYALNSVDTYINFDNNEAFTPLNKLTGHTIDVSNDEKVLIQAIETKNDLTKIIFKINGSYSYDNLSSLIFIDENFHTTLKREGQSPAAIVNEKDGLYSMTIANIDKTKKYKVAIPSQPDKDSLPKPSWETNFKIK